MTLPLLHRSATRSFRLQHVRRPTARGFVVLAIETSCDDTSVAVAEQDSTGQHPVKVHFHEKITANNDAYTGIHPLVALQSHQTTLAPLVRKALRSSPSLDLVAATRGPGMRSNLAVGLDTAKGLSLGLGVPFLGIHHMQAHALTPRLVNAMKNNSSSLKPEFPFLTVLASGGHSMLIKSTGLVEHSILAETQDIALGDCVDKSARAILPQEALKMPYGKALEDFAFPNGVQDCGYIAPARRQEELERRRTKWGWGLGPPLAEKTPRRMAYSFAGLLSSVQRFMARKVDAEGTLLDESRSPEDVSLEERQEMAREVQRVAFEHLASRIFLHLSSSPADKIQAVVVSGGVASNSYLRHVLRAMLDARGYQHIAVEFPPIHLCTDNALMIAWAAIEMWNAGYRCSLDVEPIRKWSMDPSADDGGILGPHGWTNLLR
ncbi:hypothetical protein PRZ48_001052 [Zasmidium cellare]|uniref:N(6)-L-threonylcarbamoyladenine synthase n=1 Tax=Zasmidium cellare TaxID=395010 RepID=A0ABR0F0G4_ZASCE|nr:hypothetical protein PRZ48_001052 [Zasmidium cellare]